MATPDEQWWEAQAGEYVLGTLRGTERDVFEKILSADAEVRAKVERWQERLSDLDALTPAEQPPAYLLPAIMTQIRKHNGGGAPVSAEPASIQSNPAQPNSGRRSGDEQLATDERRPAKPQPQPDNVVVHRRSSRSIRRANTLWKSVAGFATAASVLMATILYQNVNRNMTPVEPVLQTVSVVQNEQLEALWVLTTQTDTNLLQVVALAPPPVEADKSYELWMVKPDNTGVSSVGLLSQEKGGTQLLTLPIGTDQAQLFAVSQEPRGGSPEAGPTGPVLFQGAIVNL